MQQGYYERSQHQLPSMLPSAAVGRLFAAAADNQQWLCCLSPAWAALQTCIQTARASCPLLRSHALGHPPRTRTYPDRPYLLTFLTQMLLPHQRCCCCCYCCCFCCLSTQCQWVGAQCQIPLHSSSHSRSCRQTKHDLRVGCTLPILHCL